MWLRGLGMRREDDASWQSLRVMQAPGWYRRDDTLLEGGHPFNML
jgi:hypothetical protein